MCVLAHCAIVASRSVYCRQLIKIAKDKLPQSPILSHDHFKTPPFILTQDSYIEIKLADERSDALRIVLEFLYTDRIISLEGKENELETIKLIVDVYKLAVQFMLPKLKKICENFVDSSVTCSNVLSVLRYVNLFNLNVLKDFCMKFLGNSIYFYNYFF